MTKHILLVAAPLCLLAGGCNNIATTPIEVESVSFAHPDEIVRGQGFMVLADRREFVVMAFRNAVGYDNEAEGQQMHPVRVKVRRMIAENLANHPEKLKAWRRYNRTRKLQSFQYQDYALSLCADYPFRRIRPDGELGYRHTAAILKDFPDVLNDFWVTVQLDKVWNEVKADYIAEINKYDFAKMQRQMAFLWEYLRMERRDTLTLVNVPNLLETHFHAIGARYENYYYTVESPGAHAYGLNVHEYLHSIVNPLVQAATDGSDEKLLAYYKAGENKAITRSYRNPVTFTFECLVRALDHRLRVLLADGPADKKRAEDRVNYLTEEGLTLTEPFYLLLADYEKSDVSFDKFVPVMLQSLPEYDQ
ncbi:MAG: hypothetical protein JSU70_21470 [Phycisphaerales bacterium]|nr:MAG: hypothetical protein JSU70_21470 [Phycisphaerales bacterium]